MKIEAHGHTLQYEVEQIVLIFFPSHENVTLTSTLTRKDGMVFVTTVAKVDGKESVYTDAKEETAVSTKRALGNLIKRSAFFALKPLSDMPAPWGILTGVRPIKLVLSYIEEGFSETEVAKILADEYLVAEDKIRLCITIAHHEAKFSPNAKDVCIYIGIPYCPSRCAYCSFISGSGTVATKEDYVRCLLEEIWETARIIDELGLTLRAVYIGGGTPTALPDGLLHTLLSTVRTAFSMPCSMEFTVEAGRPDTVTPEKLQILKENGTTRISINPQTLHDETLRRIGRRHKVEDFFNAFSLARKAGFKNINTDLIAGLPGETFPMFKKTLDEIRVLRPESLTVHTLYIKRAATLKTEVPSANITDTAQMLQYTSACTAADGYIPYYMYRQKATVGNLENVGYALPGQSSFYNTVTMTDCANIFALGAGGVSRLLFPEKLIRVFNFKYDDAYVRQFDEILRRKSEYRKLQPFLN